MKNILRSIRLTIVFCVVIGITYVLVLWIFGQLVTPNHGKPAVETINGKVVGASNVGQEFHSNIYFWGRPSAAGDGYDAASSGGSNKGPTDPEYLAEVKARIDTFLVHHPYLQRSEVPAEMVTASGSGLDPDITPECAYVQIRRVAEARGMSEDAVKQIVEKHIQKPLLGCMGTPRVNVLQLNIALDKADKNKH